MEREQFFEKFRETYLNPNWRIQNLYYITDKEGNVVKFKMNKIQGMLHEELTGNDVILKPRQVGLSTYLCVKHLDEVIFSLLENRSVTIAVLAHKEKTVRFLWDKIRFAWQKFPQAIKDKLPKPIKDTDNELKWLETNSSIYVALEVRGGTPNKVHFSEYPFMDEKKIAATLGSVPPDGCIYREGTPNGIDGRFYFEYQEGKKDGSRLKSHFFPWWYQEEYQREVRDVRESNLNEREQFYFKKKNLNLKRIQWFRDVYKEYWMSDGSNLFDQEFCSDDVTAFMTSGQSAFNNNKLQVMLSDVEHEKRRREKFGDDAMFFNAFLRQRGKTVQIVRAAHGPLRIYFKPEPGEQYVIGMDTSTGLDHGDYQTTVVLDRRYLDVVAIYRNKTEIGGFADDVMMLGYYYNQAYICPENNDEAFGALARLVENYPKNKLYKEQPEESIKLLRRKLNPKYGFNTNKRTKNLLIGLGQDYISEDWGQIYDEDLIKELMKYQKTGTQHGYSAPRGDHDDLVVAFCLALEMDRSLPAFSPQKSIENTWKKIKFESDTNVPGHNSKLNRFKKSAWAW